jgi:hypothetical protein
MYTPTPRRGRGVYCFTSVRLSVRPRYFSSHFSQYLLMAEIWYLVTSGGTYMKLVNKYQISAINSCWEKCDEKCAYMFNVYKNQLSRQTGSRILMGPKTLPTIWGGGILFYLCPSVRPSVLTSCRPSFRSSVLPSSKIFFVAFFSVALTHNMV